MLRAVDDARCYCVAMTTSVSESHTLAAVIGKNLRAHRMKRRLSVTALADEMRAYVGKGWSRQEVYRYESGERSMSAEELVAAAMVLECTVAELTASDSPVIVGARAVDPHHLVDALSRGSAEVEGWQRFEEAAQALNDMRHAAARYANAVGYVRARAEVSPALRRRIKAFGKSASDALVRQLASLDDYRPDPNDAEPDDRGRMHANANPAMLAARDALDERQDVERLAWAWRTERKSDG